MEKKRLDVLLVEKKYFKTRERARKSIMAGVVYVDGVKENKPGMKFKTGANIMIKEDINPYVSRGGLKLEKAIKEFDIDLKGKMAIDVGASTGGFTDCMLKNGVEKVIAIDVGYGQLAWELRNNRQVISVERTNIRYVEPKDMEYVADFVTIDVSFISLKKVLPVIMNLIKETGEVVSLIKPQFEAEKTKVEKGGVIRDPKAHKEILCDILLFALDTGFGIKGLTYSPIKGPKGNIEYFLYLSKERNQDGENSIKKENIGNTVNDVVLKSYNELN